MTRFSLHDNRLGLRLPPEHRALVEQAAQARAMTLSDFCRAALVDAARDALNGNGATASPRGE